MKRMLWMLAALLLAGCEQSPIEEQSAMGAEEFYATFANDNDSRTFLDEQLRLRWTANDRITIFKKSAYNREFAFTGVTGSNAGGFRQVSVDDEFWYGATLSYNYAAYPHSNTTTFHEDGYFTLTMPAEQSYAENSVGLGANTMVAMSESGQLVFKNVGSFLRVQLYGADQSVKKITLSSIAGEALAGTAKVYPSLTDDPTCTMVGTTSSIVLNCAEAVTVNATEDAPMAFWIVVPPVTLSKGYKVTVEDADGETQEFFVNKEKTFTRNVYSTLKRELTIGQTIDPSSAVPSNQIWYTSSDETMIEPAATGESVFGATITSHTYNNGLGVITFSGDVTKVGSNAFKAKTKLVTISLPETVTEIGSYAFQNCTRLTDISAPKVTTISSHAFDNCAKLAAVPFASNLTNVGSYAFQKCTRLTSLDLKNVTSLGSYAFYECSNLEQVTLLALKGSIGSYTFFNCAKLKEITIPEAVESIGNYAFSGCSSLTSVTIPEGVKAFGGCAFSSCSSLTSVTIPDSVTQIGNSAFRGCSSLTSVTIPDSVTQIGNSAFRGCSSLTSVTIPDSVETIGLETFCDCSSLTSVTIPESVAKIGSSAFFNCKSLNSATIPNSITELGNTLFAGCSTLTSITIPESVMTIGDGAFLDCSSLTSVTIGNNVTTIGNDAFRGCESLNSVYISDLTAWCNIDFSIIANKGYYIHPCCYGASLYLKGEKITDLIIPKDIAAIKPYAFYGCSSLTSVTIPDSVTAIGVQAFKNCSSLTSVTIGNSVETIERETFRNCSSLTSVTIGNSVKTIGVYAFSKCSSLTSVTIGNSVETIENLAFWDCSSLTSVTIPDSVTAIGAQAFLGCSSLTSVTIGNSVETIGLQTFWECSSLTSVTIPESVTEIGVQAFLGCSSLKEFKGKYVSDDGRCLIIDGTLHSFAPAELTSYTIPDGVTAIGDGAFAGCNSLISVTIPDSVTTIRDYAYWTYSLTSVYCKATTPPTLGSDVFFVSGDPRSFSYRCPTIYVPTASFNIYAKDSAWNSYRIAKYDFQL